MAIHYHHTSKNDTLVFTFPLNDQSARFNRFKQDYTGSAVGQQLSGGTGEQEIYVQSGGGVKTELKIPGLNTLIDSSNITINKAELILPIVPGSADLFTSNGRLLLQALKADGTREFLLDQIGSDATFGGYLNTTDNSYHFIVTRYVQQIFSKQKENLGIQVIAAGSAVTANRTILLGSNSPFGKPKLKLTYTKL